MERFVVLGLARARAEWFRAVGQWATAALLPAEFVRCVSLEELRSRLRSGRPFSAVVVDGTLPGVDRDLIALAAEFAVSVIVVDGDQHRDWQDLGAAAVLAAHFSRDEFVEVLAATAVPVGLGVLDVADPDPVVGSPSGYVVAVTGPGGTGASTVAVALAQGLAGDSGMGRGDLARGRANPAMGRTNVVLADLCRRADQAMLHDARVVVPGIQELVEVHRTATPSASVVVDHTFHVPERGYRLLLGLRRPRHWVTLPQRALERALDGLMRSFTVVVADLESDLEGAPETGSNDIEDRNRMARSTMERAGVAVVVGEASMKGLFALTRLVEELHGFGVPPERILPVVNTAPRRPRLRAGVTRTLHELVQASIGPDAGRVAPPVQLPERPIDAAFRDGVALPSALVTPLARAVEAMHTRVGGREPADRALPVPVAPGSLGGWSESGRDELEEQ